LDKDKDKDKDKQKKGHAKKGDKKATGALDRPLSPGMLGQWAWDAGVRAQRAIESAIYEDSAAAARGGAGTASEESSPLPVLGKAGSSSGGGRAPRPLKAGVGRFYVHLVSVLRSEVSDAAEGSHYVTISVDDQEQTEKRTQTVHGSAAPVYNKNFRFVAAHYRSFLRLSLVDALTGRKIGQAIVSAYSLLQRDADVHNGDWRRASLEKLAMRDVNNVERVGHFSVRLAFEEDSKGLFSGGRPRAVAAEPPEQWSVERFQTHIARFKALISLFTDWYSEYCRIMEWENRLLTLSLFVVFVWATLKVDAEYALCCPLFVLVVLLTLSWRRRFNGQYKQYWISRGAALASTDTRPAAVLRIFVLGFRNMPDSGSGSGGSGSSGAGAAAGSAGSAGGVAGGKPTSAPASTTRSAWRVLVALDQAALRRRGVEAEAERSDLCRGPAVRPDVPQRPQRGVRG